MAVVNCIFGLLTCCNKSESVGTSFGNENSGPVGTLRRLTRLLILLTLP